MRRPQQPRPGHNRRVELYLYDGERRLWHDRRWLNSPVYRYADDYPINRIQIGMYWAWFKVVGS